MNNLLNKRFDERVVKLTTRHFICDYYLSIRNLLNTKTGLLIWKASNLWQQVLRRSLKKYELTLNEFLILETLLNVRVDSVDITQIYISKASGIDVSVVSTVLKLLEKKILIKKKADLDDRKKNNRIDQQGKFFIKYYSANNE